MDLVQQLHDQGDRGLEVGVQSHVGGRAVATTISTVVAVTGLAG